MGVIFSVMSLVSGVLMLVQLYKKIILNKKILFNPHNVIQLIHSKEEVGRKRELDFKKDIIPIMVFYFSTSHQFPSYKYSIAYLCLALFGIVFFDIAMVGLRAGYRKSPKMIANIGILSIVMCLILAVLEFVQVV